MVPGAPGARGPLHRPRDRPSRTRTERDAADYSVEREFEDLVAVVDRAGDGTTLLGHMAEVAGASPQQIELMSSRPARDARLVAAHTIPREMRADRDYAFSPSRVRGLGIPTLLLQGGDSPGAFGTAAEMAHAALTDCRVVVMPGQGHVAMDTGTDLFTAEVLRFLEET